MNERLTFEPESPLGPDLDLLFERHARDMRAETPPESIHMLPRQALDRPEIAFFVLREAGRPVGMAALKQLGQRRAEVKSMHVLTEARGAGLSRLMLRRLVAHARQTGLARLFLETGVQPGFAAARGLYRQGGFVECPPFGSYRADPNSVFMTLELRADE